MQSKTTIVRQHKIDGISEALQNLVYFVSHYKKQNLKVVRHSDLKQVLEITTKWKTELIDYQKIAQNSSIQPQHEDSAAET